MFRSISLLHRRVSPIRRCRFQRKNVSYATSHQPVLPEIDQTMASLQSVSSNSCFWLLSVCRNFDSLREAHGVLIVHGLMGDLMCDTKLVSLYGTFGHIRHARSVFDQIPHPDLYSWKVMLRWYFLNEDSIEVVKFYDHMRMHGFICENVVFSIVLNACSELRDLDGGRKVHCQIVKVADPDSFVLTGLVDMYAKCGKIKNAREVFDDIFLRNVVCWTSMIAGYTQNDCPEEGLILFNRMRESLVLGNEFTYGSLVTACGKLSALHQGKWLHGFLLKSGIEFNSYLVTSLIDMYIKCDDIHDAHLVFDEHSAVDLVSWTAMIVGYAQKGFTNEALSLFQEMKGARIRPNSVTVSSVLSCCGQLGNLEMGRSVHGISVKLGLGDPEVANALLSLYAKCRQNRDAWYAFETESDKDVIAWNSIISGFSQNGSAHEALLLFHHMCSDSVKPDAVTVVSVFSACASLGALALGSSLHTYSLKAGLLLSSDVYVGTALVNFYFKCGDSKSARIVFDTMEEKNTITWSTMIGGYGKQGDTKESLELFDDMLRKHKKPNEAIFTSILSACSHTGMVKEGKKYFSSMYKDYKHMPSTKHYACMIDMLARAGKLEEAMDVIEKMPVQPDVGCFGAFLHGCGLHSRFDLGELAIKKMLDLHPNDASYYVLVSNLYASDGRWNWVDQVRELMKQRGLSKTPGHSTVETDNTYHKRFHLRVASVG